ncbi:hypothetical protein JD969_19635 [Planctomycetota bacterium]|nr:hypothetical protein JD969_19635 [Planctomycetota bacterium]
MKRLRKYQKWIVINFVAMGVLMAAVAFVWGQNSGTNQSDEEWISNLRKMQEIQQQAEAVKKAEGEDKKFVDESYAKEQAVLAKLQTLGQDKRDAMGRVITSGKLAMNMSPVSFWGTDWAWANILTTAKWTDDRGWRKGEMFVDTKGKYPEGQYVCTWEGMAEIRFGGDGTILSYEPGRVVVDVQPQRGLTIWVRSQPNDGLKNLKLWLPGTEGQASPFYPLFVERLRPFGTIRFMNWQLTNNNKEVSWRNRPTIENQNQDGRGVALENMIALANELKSDAWFCMPAMADDDYVRQFAMMVKKDLHPDAKIYVEYSNEIWNGVFQQHRYIMDQAKKKAAIKGVKWDWLDEWSWEMSRVFKIWDEVWVDEPERIVRVIAGQEVNAWITEQLCVKVGKGNFDAIATTAYFGNKHEGGALPKVSEQQVLPLARGLVAEGVKILVNERGEARMKQGAVAKKFGVAYLTYEGGQHFTPGGKTATAVVATAQVLPEMYEAYLLNMRLTEKAGGQMFNAFDYCEPATNFGAWGHISYQNEPLEQAPKYRALLDYYNVKYPEAVDVTPK